MRHSQNWKGPSSERHEAAKTAVRKILGAYPNAERAPKDYVLVMIATLEMFSVAIIRRTADPLSGIGCKHPKFMPTQGELVEFCNMAEDRLRQLQKPTAAARIAATPHEEPSSNLKTVEERKAFVKGVLGYPVGSKGTSAASTWCFPHKLPPFDISDFPAVGGGRDQK